MCEPPSPPGRKFAHASRLASYQRLQSSNGSAPGLVPSDKPQLSFRTSRTKSVFTRIKRLAGSPTQRPKRRELASLVCLRRLPTPPGSRRSPWEISRPVRALYRLRLDIASIIRWRRMEDVATIGVLERLGGLACPSNG